MLPYIIKRSYQGFIYRIVHINKNWQADIVLRNIFTQNWMQPSQKIGIAIACFLSKGLYLQYDWDFVKKIKPMVYAVVYVRKLNSGFAWLK